MKRIVKQKDRCVEAVMFECYERGRMDKKKTEKIDKARMEDDGK